MCLVFDFRLAYNPYNLNTIKDILSPSTENFEIFLLNRNQMELENDKQN